MLTLHSQPFVWDQDEYRKHIKSVCLILGEYYGQNWVLEEVRGGLWHLDNYETKDIIYTTNLSRAIDKFIQRERLPEI